MFRRLLEFVPLSPISDTLLKLFILKNKTRYEHILRRLFMRILLKSPLKCISVQSRKPKVTV
jgi:hypothetical protein